MEITLEKSLVENQHPDVVKAIIIDGPQQGRIIQLRGDEVENAITPDEKRALEELFDVYNEYFATKETNPDDRGSAYKTAMEKLAELKEKYRGIA